MRIARAAPSLGRLVSTSWPACVVALALVTALSASAAAVAARGCPTIGDESAKPGSGRRAVARRAVGRDLAAARGRGISAWVRCPTGGPNTWTTLVPDPKPARSVGGGAHSELAGPPSGVNKTHLVIMQLYSHT